MTVEDITFQDHHRAKVRRLFESNVKTGHPRISRDNVIFSTFDPAAIAREAVFLRNFYLTRRGKL